MGAVGRDVRLVKSAPRRTDRRKERWVPQEEDYRYIRRCPARSKLLDLMLYWVTGLRWEQLARCDGS